MNGTHFSEKLRLVLARAREAADRLDHDFVAAEHLALGLLAQNDATGLKVLTNLEADPEVLRQEIEAEARRRPKLGDESRPDLPYSSDAKRALEFTFAEASEQGYSYVGTQHLVLGILREATSGASRALVAHDITLERTRSEVERVRATVPAELVPQFPSHLLLDSRVHVAMHRARTAERVAVLALIVSLVALGIVLTHR